MIYIATIHWKTDIWINTQYYYLDKFISEDYRVFAFLEDIDDQFREKFYFSINQPISDHGLKLNILADAILHDSNNDDDILIFLDGDAFPINNLVPYLKNKLEKHPLVAIRREENLGDVIAHPAFCATTIGFWNNIKGSWLKGYKYRNNLGQIVADVGGNLFNTLTTNNIDWYPVLRSNKINYHPLFFGVYDNIIYHHGAGFRDTISSVDLFEEKYFSPFNQYVKSIYRWISSPLSEKNKRRFDPYKWKRRKIKIRNTPIENKIFLMIQNDKSFYKAFF